MEEVNGTKSTSMTFNSQATLLRRVKASNVIFNNCIINKMDVIESQTIDEEGDGQSHTVDRRIPSLPSQNQASTLSQPIIGNLRTGDIQVNDSTVTFNGCSITKITVRDGIISVENNGETVVIEPEDEDPSLDQ